MIGPPFRGSLTDFMRGSKARSPCAPRFFYLNKYIIVSYYLLNLAFKSPTISTQTVSFEAQIIEAQHTNSK